MAASRRATPKKRDDSLSRLESRLASIEARLANLEGWKVTDAPPGTFPERPMAPPAPPSPAPRARPAFDLERTLGGNLLAKAGIAVLVIGVVFFLKYAFDEGWINRPARLALGFVGGTALALAGDRLRARDRSRFDVYGQVLMAGGAAIVYFTSYATYAFPEYRSFTGMSLEGASVLLGLVALALLAYTALRGTPVLTLEALLLGTLASFFGERWIGFAVVYQTALTLAAAGAAAWRRWGYVQLAAAGAAYVAFFTFLVQDVEPRQVIVGGLVTLAAVTAANFLRHKWPLAARPTTARDELVLVALWAGAAFLATWLLVLAAFEDLGLDEGLWHGPSTAGFAVVALALGFARRAPMGARWGWGLAGAVMALSWAPVQFDGSATVYAWAGLLAVCAAILRARNRLVVRLAATAAAVLILLHLALLEFVDLSEGGVKPLVGALPFAAAFLALAAVWLVGILQGSGEDPATRALLGAALSVPLLYAGAALDGYAISIAWAAQAVVLVVAGFALRLRDLRIGALLIFALVLGRVFLMDLIELDLAVRIITFLAVGTLLLLASFLYARRRQAAAPETRPPALGRRAAARPRRP